jgi:hypothetical protein
MRAALMYEAGDVRFEDVPDSVVKRPTDAGVRITASLEVLVGGHSRST